MKTMNSMLRLTLVPLALLSSLAFAESHAACIREVKDFTKQCERVCDQQLAKKNAKANDGCKKNCRDAAAQEEKRCDK